ncbi:hypothetical protein ABZY09_15380 [Streptomyces sp. NPDC002928]|uniref:hypothetical protein n=1 Tax=Streptomyces sp. NPDC002928 TaxID=3154440 RepID=UPI0033B0E02D
MIAVVTYFATSRMAKAAEEQAAAAAEALRTAQARRDEIKFELELVDGFFFDLRNRGQRQVRAEVMSGGHGTAGRRPIAEEYLEPLQALRFELPVAPGEPPPPQIWVRVNGSIMMPVPVPK